MTARSVTAMALGALVAGSSLAPTLATAQPKAKPKPITRTYTAQAPTPDPVGPLAANAQGGGTAGICEPLLDTAKYETTFKVPYAGTLKVDLTGFQGDWALGVFAGARALATSDQNLGEQTDRPEKVILKFRKAGPELTIRACNFSGGPTATLSYVYTAK